jgi:hypothetical protein
MPEYPIPPWLRPPPDPGEEYVQAFHAGATIAGEQARLNAQAIQSQQQHEMEKQRMEIARQTQNLQLGLQKQELDLQSQQVQIKTQEAARQFQAQQTFKQLIDSGVDPAKALLQVGPGLGISMTGAAQLYKQTLPQEPPQAMTTPGGREYLFNPRTGATHTFGQADLPGQYTRREGAQVASLQAEIRRIDKAEIPIAVLKKSALEGETMEETTQRLKQAQIDAKQAQIDAIISGGQMPAAPAAGSTAYSSPEAVKAAVKSGKLTRQDALKILKQDFGFQ